jgi:hypothetical protein
MDALASNSTSAASISDAHLAIRPAADCPETKDYDPWDNAFTGPSTR